ncbi:CpsD/CapB family tyrosine-protein kinase, partial [Rhizobium sp. RU36D]|uniref:polysaccharide biosynthesis tyrosine autokinase n=1 Tax=Rhizobium sp. RU36D TaxID=1907415 RepID=UPI0009D7BFBF
TQYQTLLQRLRELDTKAQLQLADSRVVNAALVPAQPSFPNRKLMFFVSVAFALVLGGAIAVLREHFVGGFTSEEQIEPVLRAKLATVIPKQTPDANLTTYSVADLVITSPLSVFSESIRRIRVGVERLLFEKTAQAAGQDRRECVVVLVSSSEPNEGKSTVSLALSRTLAKSGKKTLLIDCDFRKPSINSLLGVERSSWFADLLQGTEAAQSVSKQTIADPLSDLSVIVGDRVTDMATDDLVMGERFSQIISAARRHFEYIVIDTPPVGPVVDALYLSRHADFIVFVVRWASTSQTLVRKSLTALIENAPKGTPAMVAMNQKENTRNESSYRYSGYVR